MHRSKKENPTIRDLFPENSRLLLSGGGKEFVERIGIEAVRKVVLGVLQGENIRTQTEPLTRRRISQVCGAMMALFANGWTTVDDFTKKMSGMAIEQIKATPNDKANVWPAQWIIGLTGKSVQNVLGSKKMALAPYIEAFEAAVRDSAQHCEKDVGSLRMEMGFLEAGVRTRELNFDDITRLTTALGCAALTLRGSDKSMYGKLFERLMLGSVLTILGFQHVKHGATRGKSKVFWLSDSSGARESDATVFIEMGKVARFDIGFIGPGNSEISKDKLSRYERDFEVGGDSHNSKTFIVVDRLPQSGKTKNTAQKIGAEIIQMSLSYWPKELAIRIEKNYGIENELCTMPEKNIGKYLEQRLKLIAIEEFLAGFAADQLGAESELPEAEEEIEAES